MKLARQKIQSLFGGRNANTRRFFIAYALMQASINILYMAGFSLFIKRQGPGELPHFYIVLNIALIATQLLLSRSKIFSSLGLLKRFTVAYLGFVLISPLLMKGIPSLTPYFLFGGSILYDTFSSLLFVEYVTLHYVSRQSKQVLPAIFAAGTMAIIISGFAMKFLLEWLSLFSLYLLGASLLLGVLFIVIQEEQRAREGRGPIPSTAIGIDQSGSKPLLDLIKLFPLGGMALGIYFVFSLLRYFLEYQYTTTLNEHVATEENLAAFLGSFFSTTNLVAFGAQVFLSKHLFQWFSLGRLLRILPIVICAVAVLSIWLPAFWMVLIAQFSYAALFKICVKPGITVMVNPIPNPARTKLRLAQSFSFSLGNLATGVVMLLGGASIMHSASLWLIIGVLCLILIGFSFRVDRLYLGALNGALATRGAEGDPELFESLHYAPYTVQLREIAKLLQDPKEAVRLQALQELEHLQAPDVAVLLRERLAKEPSARVLASMVALLLKSEPDVSAAIVNLLGTHTDDRVRANILEALGHLDEELLPAETYLPYLAHQHHRVRASAIFAVLTHEQKVEYLERALSELHRMLKDQSSELNRASATAIIGKLKQPILGFTLGDMLKDPSLLVRRNALRSLGKLGGPFALRAVSKFLATCSERELADYGKEVLARLQNKNLREVGNLLGGLTTVEKRLVEDYLAEIGDDRRAKLMVQILRIPMKNQRLALAKLLKLESDDIVLRALEQATETRELRLAPLVKLFIQEGKELPQSRYEILHGLVDRQRPSEIIAIMARLGMHLWDTSLKFLRNAPVDGTEREFVLDTGLFWLFAQHASLLSEDGNGTLRAFERILSGTKQARSLAIEYLEGIMPKGIFQGMLPLFEHLRHPERISDQQRAHAMAKLSSLVQNYQAI